MQVLGSLAKIFGTHTRRHENKPISSLEFRMKAEDDAMFDPLNITVEICGYYVPRKFEVT